MQVSAASLISEGERSIRAIVDAGRLELLCNQTIRIPFVALITSAYVVYLLRDYYPLAWLVAWAVATVGLLFVRAGICRRLLRHPPLAEQVGHWINVLTGLALINGFAGGSAGWLFFDASPLETKALLTLILGCWSAAAVSISGAIPKVFYAFQVPFLIPLALCWMISGTAVGVPLGSLLLLLAVLEFLFARDNGRMVENTIRIRYEKEELIGQKEQLIERLSQSEAEATAARDAAKEADQAKSRFLAAAAHDLRQPLHALSLFVAALNETARRKSDQDIAGLGSKIALSVDALASLFSELIDISRLDAGVVPPRIEAVSARDVVEQVARDCRPDAIAKGLRLEVDAIGTPVMTDAIYLQRIARNLAENSIRYTERGRIDIRVRIESSSAFPGYDGEAHDVLVVEVEDTGVGIPLELQGQIFEEFFQIGNPGRDRRKGLGLGLAIVRRLVDKLGGTIRVRSAPGKGSIFTVRFPVKGAVVPDRPSGEDIHEALKLDVRGVGVVVIDDEADIREAITLLLEVWECKVIAAATEEEALQRAKLVSWRPDIILSDLRLAEGRSGIDALRKFAEHFPGVPSVLVTGDISAERLNELEEAGYPVLQKPVTESVLRSTIERHVPRAKRGFDRVAGGA